MSPSPRQPTRRLKVRPSHLRTSPFSAIRKANSHFSPFPGPTLPENNKPPAGQHFNVVVTGAGKGLGYAISIAYAKAGATGKLSSNIPPICCYQQSILFSPPITTNTHSPTLNSGICISSRTQSDLDALSADLKRINPNLTILSQRCDTSDPKSVAALATATTETFGTHLDVVVANAGIISKYIENEVNPKTGKVQARRLPEGVIEDEDYLRVTSVNYLGVYYTAKYFVPGLVGRQVCILFLLLFYATLLLLRTHIQFDMMLTTQSHS